MGNEGMIHMSTHSRLTPRTGETIRLATNMALAVGIALLLATPEALAQQYSIVQSFSGIYGDSPYGGVMVDTGGNLYGTTLFGGLYGNGDVFEIPSGGGLMLWYSFRGGSDGAYPDLLLLPPRPLSPSSIMYGSAPNGGILSSACANGSCGVVFEASSDGKERPLYSFTGGVDGSYPSSALIPDGIGNFYGLAALGGNFSGPCAPYGCGVVFKLTKTGQETVLYTFTGGGDGGKPAYGLLRDSAGNLYGSTEVGGAYNQGVVFKLGPSGNESVLYSFTGGADGAFPAYLVRDSGGNIYGGAVYGGSTACIFGCGVIFEVDPLGNETVLHSFTGANDGYEPFGGLILDNQGNLYSTTFLGGDQASCNPGYGCGTIFKLNTTTGAETVIHTFGSVAADGIEPLGYLTVHKGYIYGATRGGGSVNQGTVFRVAP